MRSGSVALALLLLLVCVSHHLSCGVDVSDVGAAAENQRLTKADYERLRSELAVMKGDLELHAMGLRRTARLLLQRTRDLLETLDEEADTGDIIPPSSAPAVKNPFRNLWTLNRRRTNVIAVTAGFHGEHHAEEFEEWRRQGYILIGITSYMEWPGYLSNPHDNPPYEYDYGNEMDGWLHCFRDPQRYGIPANKPQLLMPESDFADCEAEHMMPQNGTKKYDFIYSCLDIEDNCQDDWNWYNRNYTLAKEVLPVMCGHFNMTGKIMGRTNCTFPAECDGKLHSEPMLPYQEFQNELDASKMIFLPNVADASPRIMTEAFLHNVPALVNQHILGGWHYINNATGRLFADASDFPEKMAQMRRAMEDGTLKPREYFCNRWGRLNSSKRLLAWLKKNFSSFQPLDAEGVTIP